MNDKKTQDSAYSQAVSSGLYAKQTGLRKKYDNVRCYWEDETTREMLRPHLQKLLDRAQAMTRRIRILDLGCGGADGYELLSGIRKRDPGLYSAEIDMLPPDILGLYKGIELNKDLLGQARSIYGHNPKMVFEQGDFTQGLPIPDNEEPYDLYFMSYGTSSHHNEDQTMVRMLVDIARRVEDYCVVACDWLGRYSYEWQDLWVADPKELENMDYAISYIYEAEERERRRGELQHLTLRLISRPEVDDIVAEASREAGVEIRPLTFYDRSSFTGRHIETGDYNPAGQPLRQAVNSLHEDNMRTNLHSLKVDYVPKPGFDMLNNYFEHLQVCWNSLIDYACHMLEHYDKDAEAFTQLPPTMHATYPEPLKQAIGKVRRVIEGVGWLERGLPRENIIEPQLGYALRDLIMQLQKGQGCAHGMVGIFEIDKSQ